MGRMRSTKEHEDYDSLISKSHQRWSIDFLPNGIGVKRAAPCLSKNQVYLGGGGYYRIKKNQKNSQSTFNDSAPKVVSLTANMWGRRGVGVMGRSPSCPPPVTPFMPRGTNNGVFHCNFLAHGKVFKASSRRWARAECAHFQTDERHQKDAAPSLQGRNGEQACLIRSSISVSTLAVLPAALWQIYCRHRWQSFTPTQTSTAWKLRWCLWLLSRLNNSPSFLKAGFSCGGRWSPAVAVQPAPKDTVKMQQHISYSACVYTWNRVSSGHQHLIFSCCQPVPLLEGKQHHELK